MKSPTGYELPDLFFLLGHRGTDPIPAFKVSQLMHKTYRRYIANFYRHCYFLYPHFGVLSAGQYDLPQYLQISNFYMHFYLHFAIFYKLIHLQILIKGNKWRKI